MSVRIMLCLLTMSFRPIRRRGRQVGVHLLGHRLAAQGRAQHMHVGDLVLDDLADEAGPGAGHASGRQKVIASRAMLREALIIRPQSPRASHQRA